MELIRVIYNNKIGTTEEIYRDLTDDVV